MRLKFHKRNKNCILTTNAILCYNSIDAINIECKQHSLNDRGTMRRRYHTYRNSIKTLPAYGWRETSVSAIGKPFFALGNVAELWFVGVLVVAVVKTMAGERPVVFDNWNFEAITRQVKEMAA